MSVTTLVPMAPALYAVRPRTIVQDLRLAPPVQVLTADERRRLIEEHLLPYSKALFRFALKLTNDRVQAEDLVQDTYFKVCRYIDHFQIGSNAKAWLFRILKNSFINEYRRTQYRPGAYEMADLSRMSARKQIAQLQTSHQHQETSWTHQLLGDEVTRAMHALPADYRIVVVLSDLDGFSYEEIAKIIGIPVGTVRSRLHRGRKMLKARLADYAAQRGFAVKDGEDDSMEAA